MRAFRTIALLALTLATVPMAANASSAGSVRHGEGPMRLGPHPPAARQHSEFFVEINKLGQVTRATKVVRSTDSSFNAITYGNALQAYIRTPDGKAIPGTYRLSYDYNPANKMVRRSVALVKMGGVNPNAIGAVNVEAAKLRAEQTRVQAASAEASALPNLHQMTRHHR